MRYHELIERANVDTPAFQQWFAGSKVVDRHGKPMVMYHGAFDNFETFHPISHFGTRKAANQRVHDVAQGEYSTLAGKLGHVMPVYLAIKNPLRVTDQEASGEHVLLRSIIEGKYPFDLDTARKDGAYAAAQAAGYDGLVYANRLEDIGQDSWVIFSPAQVKSAIMNEAIDIRGLRF